MQTINVPQLIWYGPRDLELTLPDDWQVEMNHMEGYDRPELAAAEIAFAIKNPIGSVPLRKLAKGKREAVIVFDDQTRATRTAKIVPAVLEELAAAGITDAHIRFICGLGMHAPMARQDFVKKLGEDVVSRYRCFNHNPFGNCVRVGTTSTLQTEVCINEEYMKCDLKIIIGACVPHPAVGFGGGSKMILPGLASYESIKCNHGRGGVIHSNPLDPDAKPIQGMGIVDDNPTKRDIDEAADMVGIDFMINAILNLWGESSAIYAGDWKQVQAASLEDAKTNYRTPKMLDKDIVIANMYTKVNEANVGMVNAFPLVSKKGGDVVVIANAPEGQITHYLASCFGIYTFAEQHSEAKVPSNVNKVYVYTEYPHPGASWFEEHDKIVYLSKWDNVLRELRERHGTGARVGIIPDATNQYFAWYD